MRNFDCIIIGGGSAALSSAIELKKNGIDNILIIEKGNELGGILNQCIHNGFGLHKFKEELSGPSYAQKYIDLLLSLNIPYMLNTTVTKLNLDKTIEISSKDGYEVLSAKAIILAMGCQERTSGQIQIPGYRPSGIYTAGTAQRFINIDGYLVGKKVFILGSGDIGLIMARRMVLEGAKVIGVAEILPYSNGLQRNIVQCLNDYNIPLYLSHTITDIEGKDKLTKIILSKVDENRKPIKGSEIEFEVDTLLLSIGLIPDNTLAIDANIEIDKRTKGVLVNEDYESTSDGIFACGNVLHVHDLVDYVSSEAEKTAYGVINYLKHTHHKKRTINTMAGNGINYVLPQRIDYPDDDIQVDLSFRVNKPYRDVLIEIKHDNESLKTIKKTRLLPAEMEKIILDKEILKKLNHDIIISIKED